MKSLSQNNQRSSFTFSWPDVRLLFAADLAIDLGAANTRIFVPGRGVTLNEPSIVALREGDGKPVAAGRMAQPMIGRAPASIRVVRPLRRGVIADAGAAVKMLTIFIRRAIAQPTLLRPQVLLCTPADLTAVERRALEEVARGAGARRVNFIEEPVAAAIGVGVEQVTARASAIIDVGAETVDVAVMSGGGLIQSATHHIGGRAMDRAICGYLRERRHFEIGEETAEMIKLNLGSATLRQPSRAIEVGGRSLIRRLPEQIIVTSDEIQSALDPVISEIVRAVIKALGELPPEVAADLLEEGVTLTGGAAQLPGLAEMIGERMGLEAHLAANPMLAAVTGAARIFWPETPTSELSPLTEPSMSGGPTALAFMSDTHR